MIMILIGSIIYLPLYLPIILPNTVTTYSPFYLVHGREPRLPCDATFPTSLVPIEPNCPLTRARKAQEANIAAKHKTEVFQNKQKIAFDSKHPFCSFKPGQTVLHVRFEPVPGEVQKFPVSYT